MSATASARVVVARLMPIVMARRIVVMITVTDGLAGVIVVVGRVVVVVMTARMSAGVMSTRVAGPMGTIATVTNASQVDMHTAPGNVEAAAANTRGVEELADVWWAEHVDEDEVLAGDEVDVACEVFGEDGVVEVGEDDEQGAAAQAGADEGVEFVVVGCDAAWL